MKNINRKWLHVVGTPQTYFKLPQSLETCFFNFVLFTGYHEWSLTLNIKHEQTNWNKFVSDKISNIFFSMFKKWLLLTCIFFIWLDDRYSTSSVYKKKRQKIIWKIKVEAQGIYYKNYEVNIRPERIAYT